MFSKRIKFVVVTIHVSCTPNTSVNGMRTLFLNLSNPFRLPFSTRSRFISFTASSFKTVNISSVGLSHRRVLMVLSLIFPSAVTPIVDIESKIKFLTWYWPNHYFLVFCRLLTSYSYSSRICDHPRTYCIMAFATQWWWFPCIPNTSPLSYWNTLDLVYCTASFNIVWIGLPSLYTYLHMLDGFISTTA